MLNLRINVSAALSPQVVQLLESEPTVSGLSVFAGASVKPRGDLVLAQLPREASDDVMQTLMELGVQETGTIQLEPVRTWVSRAGYRAQQEAPGSSADAVVWSEVTQQAYNDSELNWTHITFMALATLIASIAIVLDSQILVIGAMVLGPEFGAVAAIGLALVRRRWGLLADATRTLAIGFTVAIILAFLAGLLGRYLGWVTLEDLLGPRPGTAFIYTPDKWSLLVSLIAGAAGVLSLTSARSGGLAGVFISVTTIPAAGNIALGLAFGAWSEVIGSGEQLVINLLGMVFAGWFTLVLQQLLWGRVSQARRQLRDRLRSRTPKNPPALRTS